MFEVQPTRVRPGHWRLAIALVVLIGVATFGSALATKPALVAGQKGMSIGGPGLLAQALPSQLDCHDLARAVCEVATRAALTLLTPDDGAISSAGAWKSLVCSESMDCSTIRLTPDSTPMGSVILKFPKVPDAWINVVSRPGPTATGASGPFTVAWLVRWQ
jgi:hypothetical protein